MNRSASIQPPSKLRFWIVSLLLALAVVTQLYRIVTVRSNTGETPFLSANDRSRWCTILALSATGSYEIDQIIQIRDPLTNRRTWYTIDMVQHRGADGQQHFYSSKPPLLPTLYAGVYWMVRQITGWGLLTHPFEVAQVMLILVNLLPMLVLWWLMIGWTKTANLDIWQFTAMIALATLGTFLSTFIVTLNNHLPAAVATGVSFWALQRIGVQRDERSRWFALAGLAASFAAANELPALSWLCMVGGLLSLTNLRKTLVIFVPATLPVAIGFFATNYWAHGTWRPAYSQREVGQLIALIPWTDSARDLSDVETQPIIDRLRPMGIDLSEQTVIRPGRRAGVWELWDETSQWRIALRQEGSNQLGLYHWGDWYDYPGSYWLDENKRGVDRGEPNALKYAWHCLLGHHGIFSLTPMWLLVFVGAFYVLRGCQALHNSSCAEPPKCSADNVIENHPTSHKADTIHAAERLLAGAILIVSFVVVGFYLARPLEDRNYGGVCSGLRWAFWLIPLWYWLALRGARLIRGWKLRSALLILLAISIYSASEPWRNPWVSPWLDRYFAPQDPT